MAKQLNHYVCECYAIVDVTSRASTSTGAAVASWAVKVNNNYTTKDGSEVEKGLIWSVVAFGKPAEIAINYVKKGQHLLLSGSIEQSKFKREGSDIEETRSQLIVANIDGLRILTPASGSTKSVLEKIESDMESVLALRKTWSPEEVIEMLKNSMEKARPTSPTSHANGNGTAQPKKQVVNDDPPPPDEAFV